MNHAHHWLIAPPDGRSELPAECECGERKVFKSIGWVNLDWDALYGVKKEPKWAVKL